MYGYIYEIKNKLNNKIYIGKHKSETFDQNYHGSGKILKQAIKKEGWNNFDYKMIDIANNLEELNSKEKFWISKYKELNYNLYNISNGGDGGDIFSLLSVEEQTNKRIKHSLDTSARSWYTNGVINKYLKDTDIIPQGFTLGRTVKPTVGKYIRTDTIKNKLSLSHKGKKSKFKGIPRSTEIKNKISQSVIKNWSNKPLEEKLAINKKKGRSRYGQANAVYGSHYKWVTNELIEFRVYEKDYNKLEQYYKQGFRNGRCNKSIFKR